MNTMIYKIKRTVVVGMIFLIYTTTSAEAGSDWNYYMVKYDENNYAHLYNPEGEDIAGPYPYIENEQTSFWKFPCRYIGQNGLYGYLDETGREVTPPLFREAGVFVDGWAMVSENGSDVYYINNNGMRMTKNYCDGCAFESQGWYARVLLDDGTWGIIDAWDRLVFSGAERIDALSYVSTIGCCVVDGHAVLFNLCPAPDEDEFRIIREYEEFADINMAMETYAVVKNTDGLYGVVNSRGELIIADIYASIDYQTIFKTTETEKDGEIKTEILFLLEKSDGTQEIMIEPVW